MMKLIYALTLIFVGLIFIGFSANAGQQLTQVPNHEVCMVTDAHFNRPQIPVKVGDKTYYGCCENCKTTLAVDQDARIGTDALTGEKVDKAKAVIAAKKDGSVLYFASLDNFKKYQKQKK